MENSTVLNSELVFYNQPKLWPYLLACVALVISCIVVINSVFFSLSISCQKANPEHNFATCEIREKTFPLPFLDNTQKLTNVSKASKTSLTSAKTSVSISSTATNSKISTTVSTGVFDASSMWLAYPKDEASVSINKFLSSSSQDSLEYSITPATITNFLLIIIMGILFGGTFLIFNRYYKLYQAPSLLAMRGNTLYMRLPGRDLKSIRLSRVEGIDKIHGSKAQSHARWWLGRALFLGIGYKNTYPVVWLGIPIYPVLVRAKISGFNGKSALFSFFVLNAKQDKELNAKLKELNQKCAIARMGEEEKTK